MMSTNKKPKGLGRGLEALLGASQPDIQSTSEGVSAAVSSLRLEQLQPGKYQPRTRMDEGALQELADSIKAQGLMQPILVRKISAANYEIIAGERRFRAAKLAGLSEVPVWVKDVPDESAAAMALIENIQREDLNPLEEAQGVQRLINDFGLTHEQAAQAIGRSRSATSNLLRLLNLAKPVQDMLFAGDLDMGHARALLALDAASQITLGHQVVAKRLSVREAEKLVTKVAQEFALQGSQAPRQPEKSRDVVRLEEELSDALATRVSLKANSKGRGQLVIDFNDFEQLDGLIARFRQS
jgi:ParB family chromosome partitioning protein